MRNLKRPILISDNIPFAKGKKKGPKFILILFFIVTVFHSNSIYADKCKDCHLEPKHKSNDEKSKECLHCHVKEGHSNKDIQYYTNSSPLSASFKPDFNDMVLIPSGEFIMGTDDRFKDEKPAHVVYINAFYIDRFEVSNEDYKKFVDSTGHHPPEDWRDKNYPHGKEKHPVIFIDWFDAGSYCKWLGKRLPREAEWEKAARGIDGYIYPWGNKWDTNRSNNPLKGNIGSISIGLFEEGKSPYGLYDMSGNVWEWVDDYYLPHPGSDYLSPEFGKNYRILKGGSWMDCMFYGCGISAPTFNRAFFDPHTKNDSFGFRCAADSR
jgi:formylglycine-generating enzyme required for sulfatase activity